MQDEAPKAHEVDETVPRELSRICERALVRDRDERTATVADLANDLRHWQTEGTLERQIDALRESAEDELRQAPKLSGNLLLWHLDRALGHCNRIE